MLFKAIFKTVVAVFCALVFFAHNTDAWQSDNGNGTFTNPLFYEDFSDPDIIRVGNVAVDDSALRSGDIVGLGLLTVH